MPQGNPKPTGAPRHTEDAARTMLPGLMGEILTLMRSDDPKAWGRIALIGREIASVGTTTEDALTRRQQVQTVSIHVHGPSCGCCVYRSAAVALLGMPARGAK